MEAESVSWKRNLFHGSRICFMAIESVLWKQNLLTGEKLLLTHYKFMSLDLICFDPAMI